MVLQVIKAQSEKKAGEEKVKSEAAVKTAKELADKEVEEAKAKKVQAALKAEKIVPAEIQKQEAMLQADAEAEKIKRRADAEAAAHLAKAEAEAKAIQMKLMLKPTDLRLWWKQQNPILRLLSSTRWLINGKKLLENRLRRSSTSISEISRYLTVVKTAPVISLTMLLRPLLQRWESLISFRLQIL